jgi:hypothetical protein
MTPPSPRILLITTLRMRHVEGVHVMTVQAHPT